MNPILTIAGKEGGELLRSARGVAWLLAMAVVLSVFSLLLVASTELSLLDNAQVVYDMCGITIGLGALLTIVMGVDSVAGENERGSLVPLLLTPVSREGILYGKLAGLALAWAAMCLITMPYLWAAGSTGQNLGAGIVSLVLFGTPVVLGFGFLALGVGSRMASSRGSLMTCLIVLLLSASPILIGPSLRQSAIGRIFDWVNPFSCAMNALDAVIIDSQPVLSQWAHWAVALAFVGVTLWLARTLFRKTAY